MTNSPTYELDHGRGLAADDLRPHPQDLFDAVDSQSPRAPLLVVMLIGLFAFTVLTMGSTILFRIPYYLGILSAPLGHPGLFSVLSADPAAGHPLRFLDRVVACDGARR